MSKNWKPTAGAIVRVTRSSTGAYVATLPDGTEVTEHFENYQLRNAVKEGKALKYTEIATGDHQWRKVSAAEFSAAAKTAVPAAPNGETNDHDQLIGFVKNAAAIRPSSYKMSDLNWRFAVRTVLRGKNVMIVGPKGCGKTVLAFTLADVLDRPLFNIPLGATQDPRSSLIGNVHYDPTRGTYVGTSEFIRAISTPNAIVLLDEVSRAHPDAWNILMTPLDLKQRFVRVDEAPNTPTIPVAEGVTFIMTANIGAQYTATRTMDAALLDRCVMVEVEYLGREQELELLRERVPGVADNVLQCLTAAAIDIRREATGADPRLSEGLSTRTTIEVAELIYDGFTFDEAARLVIYPQYSAVGEPDSERTLVKQIIQKHMPTAYDDKSAPFAVDPNDNDLPWKA